MALYDGIQEKIPVFIASFAGSVVSLILRGDRSLWTGFGTFTSGIVIGYYGGNIFAVHVGISDTAGTAVMAMAGRQIASWITMISVKDMVSIFSKGKTP